MAAPEGEDSVPELDEPGGMGDMTAGEFLDWAGTDAVKWARAFMGRNTVITADMEAIMVGWFANAIEAGRKAEQDEHGVGEGLPD